MTNPRPVKYTIAKYLTVILTGATNLLGLTGALSLSEGQHLMGFIVVGLYLMLLVFDSWLYIWILEQIGRS